MNRNIWFRRGAVLVAVAVAVAVGGLLSGCRGGILGSQPYRDVTYYDLRNPAARPAADYNLDIVSLRMLAPGRNKMVYRDASCRVLIDDYNKWVQSPSFLIRQYLQAVFSAEGRTIGGVEPVSLRLRGSIVDFEIDLRSREVVLGMEYTISSLNSNSEQLQSSRVIREKYQEQSPEQFAEAMSRAAGRLSGFIADDAEQLARRLRAAAPAKK